MGYINNPNYHTVITLSLIIGRPGEDRHDCVRYNVNYYGNGVITSRISGDQIEEELKIQNSLEDSLFVIRHNYHKVDCLSETIPLFFENMDIFYGVPKSICDGCRVLDCSHAINSRIMLKKEFADAKFLKRGNKCKDENLAKIVRYLATRQRLYDLNIKIKDEKDKKNRVDSIKRAAEQLRTEKLR